jgi:midasin
VHPNHSFDEKDFVTTKSFKSLLKQLAGVVAVSDYAVILQGPTSAGKTSTVQYLANITQNKVIRINNHMHTDIQEYLGSYVPDKEGGGKLIFQEGVLVEAVRNGYWVILDELNLAPSEVLEALNRLLDDNRELLIVETQKVIKAHPNFRIFATQNPTEGYGGRKELSEAFKNRFILINVHDVPLDELVEILINKCQLPKSRAELMVKVMEQLQIYRSQGSNLFSGKDSTITVRDLLKWASRLTHQSTTSSVHDLAIEGYFVLGERSRNEMDKLFIKETIEKVAKVKIEDRQYYEDYFAKNLAKQFSEIPQKLDLPRLIQSQQLKRLAVLVHKCLLNQEPVLLVGETGCGKTTLCQVFSAIGDQQLFSINCHQNTETSDFIGCMRTRKNLKQTQDLFVANYTSFLQTLGIEDVSPYVLEDDSSLKTIRTRFSALSKHLKTQSISEGAQGQLSALKALRDDLTCIFEWHDGILVEAMQQGGLLLIDEISLANDSVLERLNSVFEADRTLMISEKSSKEAVKVVGHPNFKMVATMNPSGDFGKKELSPALRNRMTEIWVESYFH